MAYLKINIVKGIFFIFIVCSSIFVRSQSVVEFDLSKRNFAKDKQVLPFDEPFFFLLKDAKKGGKYTIQINEVKGFGKNPCVYTVSQNAYADGVLTLPINEFLKPNKTFSIKIDCETNQPISEEKKNYLKTSTKLAVFKDNFYAAYFTSRITVENYLTFPYQVFEESFFQLLNTSGSQQYRIIELTKEEKGGLKIYLDEARAKMKTGSERLLRLKKLYEECYTNLRDSIKSKYPPPEEESKNEIKEPFLQVFGIYEYRFLLLPSNNALYIDSSNSLAKVREGKELITTLHKEVEYIKQKVSDWLNNLIEVTVSRRIEEVMLISTTNQNVTSDNAPYFSQTFGVGYVPNTRLGISYFSFNIFFRPVNNNVPLSNIKGRWAPFFARTSLNVGFTLEEIRTNQPEDLESPLPSVLGKRAALIGLGIRPLHFLKFDFNLLWYNTKPNGNPAQEFKAVFAPMIGLSVNLNIAKIISGQPNSLTLLQKKIKE